MSARHHALGSVIAKAAAPVLLWLTIAPLPALAQSSPAAGRFVLVAKTAADYDALRQEAVNLGGRIIRDMRAIQTLVVSAPAAFRGNIANSPRLDGVAPDRIKRLIRPEMKADMRWNGSPALNRMAVSLAGGTLSVTPDPAFKLPGLLWNVSRIHAPEAWRISLGQPDVKVGVADTGLDFTHSEIAAQIADIVDLTGTEDPPICKYYFGFSDADLAAAYGGPANTDWNGHGSWIGGNIAGALNGTGLNGIAPRIKLVGLKISQWCGSAYDSTIIDSFLYAADHGIDIVSISFGGYLDLSDRDQLLIYKRYVETVLYAASKGTVIVSSLGNDHLQIGAGGLVMSHGPLTTPGDSFTDYYGLYQNPAGIPGVVAVSATGNVVNATSPTCAAGTTGNNATCKPASDAHQPFGVGRLNQLAYYSNYGPRVDFAAPGGARKFNLPFWDRGGTPGYPVTSADGANAWQTFSITSNWSTQIPCYYFVGSAPLFPDYQCYSTIQGTSMATPHVSAALALIASRNAWARHNPVALLGLLTAAAQTITGNKMPPLSATDLSAGDLSGILCPTGYCHVGGPPIPDREAYGKGLVDARAILQQ